MSATVTLRKRHYKFAAEKARELGKTPQIYIESLIDAAALSFKEILSPVRDAFAASGVTEEQLDEVVTNTRKAIYSRPHRKSGK